MSENMSLGSQDVKLLQIDLNIQYKPLIKIQAGFLEMQTRWLKNLFGMMNKKE